MNRICLYYRQELERDRWFSGDRFIRPAIRRLVRGRRRPGGLDRVFLNLCAGLDRLGFAYEVNLPFKKLRSNDLVGVLGRGRAALAGYDRPNPILAGIGLMTHPSEWPTLFSDYPVALYLQHSQWANDVYRPYYGEKTAIWPVGIDTDFWRPSTHKDFDFLVYDKVYWNREQQQRSLIQPILATLSQRGLRSVSVRYGDYEPEEYRALLWRSRAMIFLSAHESQGLAYQECLSCDVPVFAWDQGWCQDPARFQWGTPEMRTTTVPYFDERCGDKFSTFAEFESKLDHFLARQHRRELRPRSYVLERLTLEKCAAQYVDLLWSTRQS